MGEGLPRSSNDRKKRAHRESLDGRTARALRFWIDDVVRPGVAIPLSDLPNLPSTHDLLTKRKEITIFVENRHIDDAQLSTASASEVLGNDC